MLRGDGPGASGISNCRWAGCKYVDTVVLGLMEGAKLVAVRDIAIAGQ
jgi:hypothetical protein